MLMRLAAKAKLTQLTVASAGDRKKALTVMLYSSMGHISLHTQPAQGYAAVDMFVGHDLPRLTVRDGVLALAVSVIRSYGGQVIRRAL
jgi:S-adenosylmethionine/arginine decarboxylase-like enzyme